MTNVRRIFLLALVLALPLRAAETPPKTTFRTGGSSSAEELRAADGTWIGRTARTRHDFVPAPWAGEKARFLLTSKFTREERSDREGATDFRPLERVVIYLSMMAAGDDSAYKASRESVGILTLAGRGGASDRIVISRSPREDMGTPRVLVVEAGGKEPLDFARLKDARKGRRPADAVRGVTVVLDWGGGVVARIPVERDGFDLAEADLPKGFAGSHETR
jgi:hypothetical protein